MLWNLEERSLTVENRASREAVYTLGNGYFGCRGFFEEEREGLLALGGIYMAGIFGAGNLEAWEGMNRELVNTPNMLAVLIQADGETVTMNEKDCTDYRRTLDIQNGILTRSYIWKNKLKLEFERFVSVADIHVVCQRIRAVPLTDKPVAVQIKGYIDTNVTNLNKVSCEPLPVQPGDKHFHVLKQDEHTALIETDGMTPEQIAYRQTVSFDGMTFTRQICVYTSRDTDNPEQEANRILPDYESCLEAHKNEWKRRWGVADIRIEGCDDDQLAVRYNLFQLMQVCPRNDPRISIGARGLTGEMYEGCVFWDTEIFKLPFFIFTNPEAARSLLQFRYTTLPAARKHAKDNWFDGAMYAWQSCNLGYEQTEKNVGAFYAIHIIADIAYALMQYYRATGDMDFMAHYGLEILIETSRFWVSRTTYRAETGVYDLLAVRGPNEYDVIVHNNCYTNMMVQENLQNAVNMIELIKENHTDTWNALKKKLDFNDREILKWQDIAQHIVICYDAEKDLYEEDSMYPYRVPLDLKKAKPTGKRIIDSTMPYEALPLYQVTKQADVLCLMNYLPWRFTDKQKKIAWDYYEPKTAHDSSLSYCSHAIIAARLGMDELAYQYFRICAYLDIEDVKLNTISGLHFANFGGTWQAIVYGFAGLSFEEEALVLNPRMPKEWRSAVFNVHFQGSVIEITAMGTNAVAKLVKAGEKPVTVMINGCKQVLI